MNGRMNRRGFLGAIAAAVAGATLDPDRALWVPGRKLISIPAPLRGGENIFNADNPGNFLLAARIFYHESTVALAFAQRGELMPGGLFSRRGESLRSYIDRTLPYAPDPYVIRACAQGGAH